MYTCFSLPRFLGIQLYSLLAFSLFLSFECAHMLKTCVDGFKHAFVFSLQCTRAHTNWIYASQHTVHLTRHTCAWCFNLLVGHSPTLQLSRDVLVPRPFFFVGEGEMDADLGMKGEERGRKRGGFRWWMMMGCMIRWIIIRAIWRELDHTRLDYTARLTLQFLYFVLRWMRYCSSCISCW